MLELTQKVNAAIERFSVPMRVAVMGCRERAGEARGRRRHRQRQRARVHHPPGRGGGEGARGELVDALLAEARAVAAEKAAASERADQSEPGSGERA